MLRTVQTIRYVLALREGGSLPAIVEADDLGLYVVKFRGAGQGPLALVAELVAGEIGRALGLKVPELVFAEVDAALGRNEPDAEIRHLLKASTGLNLALDYLPGSTMFDPAAGDRATPEIASMAVWFDAFVQNVDRTPRNPNLLIWHHSLHFIDHGAALFFHHNWETSEEKAELALPGDSAARAAAVGQRDSGRVRIGPSTPHTRSAARDSQPGARCLDRFRRHDRGGTPRAVLQVPESPSGDRSKLRTGGDPCSPKLRLTMPCCAWSRASSGRSSSISV